jgi:hypothetical protein
VPQEGVDREFRNTQGRASPDKGVSPVKPLRFADMDPPSPREYVVQGIAPKGHTTTIFGDGGSAKSVLALSLATAVAGGVEEWIGRKVQNSPVLYGDFELDAEEQRRRAYQVARGAASKGRPTTSSTSPASGGVRGTYSRHAWRPAPRRASGSSSSTRSGEPCRVTPGTPAT